MERFTLYYLFGSEFVIGYYGRVADRIIRVPLRRVFADPAGHIACQITDAEGESP